MEEFDISSAQKKVTGPELSRGCWGDVGDVAGNDVFELVAFDARDGELVGGLVDAVVDDDDGDDGGNAMFELIAAEHNVAASNAVMNLDDNADADADAADDDDPKALCDEYCVDVSITIHSVTPAGTEMTAESDDDRAESKETVGGGGGRKTMSASWHFCE
jgi:hypothetical protein